MQGDLHWRLGKPRPTIVESFTAPRMAACRQISNCPPHSTITRKASAIINASGAQAGKPNA